MALTISERLKEERQRLSYSQTAFAALAGVTKSAQIKWEGGASSAPTAPALAAMAEAGADVLYILTGRRSVERPSDRTSRVEAMLAATYQDIVSPNGKPLAGESADQADARTLDRHARALSNILRHERQHLPTELADEVEHVLDIVSTPSAVILHRAHHRGQQRSRRRDMRERLLALLEAGGYVPRDGVAELAVTLAIDHGTPLQLLADLVEDVRDDARSGS